MPEQVSMLRELAFILKKQRDADLPLEFEFSQALLSEIAGRYVDSIEFRIVCSSLVDAGVLKPLEGDAPSLNWTENGYGLADAHSADLDNTLKKQVVTIVQQYRRLSSDQRGAFRQGLLANVPVAGPIFVRRANLADPAACLVNAAIIESRPTKHDFWTVRYRLVDFKRLKFKPSLESVKERFLKELGFSPPDWAVAWVEDDETITVVSTAQLPNRHPYYQAHLEVIHTSAATEVPAERGNFIQGEVLLQGIEASARARGWGKERFGQVFFDFLTKTRQQADDVSFTEYPTMRTELLRINASGINAPVSRMALVADSGRHQFVTVYDWVSSSLPVESLCEASTEFADEGAFQVIPELESCAICRPLDVAKIKRPEDKLDIKLKYGGKTRSVIADRIALRRDALDFSLGGSPSRPKTSMEPGERLSRTRSWLKDVVPSTLRMNGFEFKAIDFEPVLSELTPKTKKDSTWQLNPPKLRFYQPRQKEAISTDPRSLFRFGPLSSPQKVDVVACVMPSDLTRERATQFLESLADAYQSASLGTLDIGHCAFLFYKESNIEEVKGGLQSLPVPGVSREIVLVLGRDRVGTVYGRGKDLVSGVASRPSQFCNLSTALKIADGSYPTAKGLALQTYLKTLKRGETPWQLGETVSKKKTLFVGIGYSRRPETDEEISSHASLSLAEGVGVTWKALGFSMRPRRFFDFALADSFIRFLEVESANYPSLERIVILRRGDVYPAEVDAIESKLHQLEAEWTLDFVSVSDSNVRIFRKGDPPGNPISGFLFLLGDNRCLLSVSALPNEEVPEGSVRLLELTRVIGSTPMGEIGREVYDQTFLCWGSPSKPPKIPLPLDLAEKVAELALSVSRPEVFDYFPL